MKSQRLKSVFVVLLLILFVVPALSQENTNPKVLLKTNLGDIHLELYPDKAPVSVENFLSYVKSGHYDNTIFHRVIRGFMIQGGAFDKNYKEKSKNDPIVNEAHNGLKNKRGTIAYARTNVVNSATCQFFINHQNNVALDHKSTKDAEYGYAVLGKVVEGMGVVDKIAKVATVKKALTILYQGKNYKQERADVPKTKTYIKSASIIEE